MTIFALSYNPYSLIYIHANTIMLVLVPYVVPDTDDGYSARYGAGYGTGNIAEKITQIHALLSQSNDDKII